MDELDTGYFVVSIYATKYPISDTYYPECHVQTTVEWTNPTERRRQRDEAPVLRVDNLAVAYRVRGGEVEAVQDVSFDLNRGESFGIVGESGCGKSTVAWSIVNFLGANGYVKRGRILFQGQELVGKDAEELRRLRGDRIAMVYQDPMQALNPSMRLATSWPRC